MTKFTHNDVNIGNRVTLAHRNDDFIVTDVLDGHRGIGVSRGTDIHSKERIFVDIEEVRTVNGKTKEPLTDELNRLVAEYIKARDNLELPTHTAAVALADFCASIFEKPFVAKTDDGRECQVPHKSSQDAYRNTWNGEGANVSCHTLRLIVMPTSPSWHGGKGRNMRP